jgi:hypothetical protein
MGTTVVPQLEADPLITFEGVKKFGPWLAKYEVGSQISQNDPPNPIGNAIPGLRTKHTDGYFLTFPLNFFKIVTCELTLKTTY